MTESNPDQFEMRRLESLSNTIFGVAMTLLAYDAPRAAQFDHMPDWADLYQLYGGRLMALVLSFIIAGLFWFSQHRRLARQSFAGRGVVMLNLLFLLWIILLPITNGLYGSYGASSAVAVLYALHLTVSAALNSLLWWLVTRSVRDPDFIGAIVPVLALAPGTLVASIAPHYSQYFLWLAFGGPVVRRFFGREAG